MSRRVAFKGHLLGKCLAGSYPYRGPAAGGGCTYLCLDLDNHDGHADIDARLRAVAATCREAGLRPLYATSRSGTGVHVYLFLDAPVATEEAHNMGREILHAAGVWDRADVIPSARHPGGMGTLHALPLSPMAAPGGGILLDENFRPVLDPAAQVALLRGKATSRAQASYSIHPSRTEPYSRTPCS
ncbi:MAG: hypothetical protein GWO24_05875, partial [Akkermansiaceae bacterium]|nr:hypothetical protein [Akkermansiaceae bacterium]